MRRDLLCCIDQRIAGRRAHGIGRDATGDFGTGVGLRGQEVAAHLGGRGLRFEKTRNQVGATGKRAGLRDLDGVGHAQRGGGGRLSRTASRISKRPIKSSGVGSIIHQ